jgi:hypothetical protein
MKLNYGGESIRKASFLMWGKLYFLGEEYCLDGKVLLGWGSNLKGDYGRVLDLMRSGSSVNGSWIESFDDLDDEDLSLHS